VLNKDSSYISLFLPTEKPYGRSYGAWTAKWWQWILSIPKPKNPLLDQTGENWMIGQPISDVWFLAGCYRDFERKYPHRKIEIPRGRGILFPVLNCEANPLEYPKLHSHEDLINHVTHDVSTVVRKSVSVNGVSMNPSRVQSDPQIFKVTLTSNNVFETMNSGTTYASADGYWIFLKPLPIDRYNICFEGSCEFGSLHSGADYVLSIV
jgi:hypothetical protein